MTEGPKRTTTEPTLVIPRESLRPVSKVPGPTIDQLADIARGERDLEETLVPCPSCESCAPCGGSHMVTPARAAELRKKPTLSEPGDDHA